MLFALAVVATIYCVTAAVPLFLPSSLSLAQPLSLWKWKNGSAHYTHTVVGDWNLGLRLRRRQAKTKTSVVAGREREERERRERERERARRERALTAPQRMS